MRNVPLSASSGTRSTMRLPRLNNTGAARSPTMATGLRYEIGPRFVPSTSISPPGRAMSGSISSMRGAWLASDLIRGVIRRYSRTRPLPPMMHDQANQKRINPGRHVIHHDAQPAMQPFQLPCWPGLHNIKQTKQPESQQCMPNLDRAGDKRDPLPGHFVDYDLPRVFPAALALYNRASRN